MKVAENVYAAGDIVSFPLPLIDDSVSIGHWQIAHNHGHIAAMNMMGKVKTFNSIPFFWTVLFGKSLRYCGKFAKFLYTLFHSYQFILVCDKNSSFFCVLVYSIIRVCSVLG